MVKATVSGSFHRHMGAITAAVQELADLSVRVLSPADPRIVAQQGEFLFVASDPIRSVRLVQDRHLESIRAADFLWLVCPDGYVGQSASMEIGYAAAVGVPIFATQMPSDLTLRQYVKIVPSLAAATNIASSSGRQRSREGLLINRNVSVEEAHLVLERIGLTLMRSGTVGDPARQVHADVALLRAAVALPTIMQ